MADDGLANPLTDCDGTEVARVRRGGLWRWLPIRLIRDTARLEAIEIRLGAVEARLAALEARPEEVVPFTASLTTGVLAIGARAFTLTVPGIRAGERVDVAAVDALPAGLSITAARAPKADTVEVTLTAGVALTASRTLALAITALR